MTLRHNRGENRAGPAICVSLAGEAEIITPIGRIYSTWNDARALLYVYSTKDKRTLGTRTFQ